MKVWLNLGILAYALLSMAGCGSASTHAKTLERDGGARITLHATCFPDQANCDPNARLNDVMDALKRRSLAAGYGDVAVHTGSEAQTVVVDVSGVGDGQQLVPLLTNRGQIYFIDTGGMGLTVGEDVSDNICMDRCKLGQYAVLFRGKDLDQSQVRATTDPTNNQPVVILAFKDDAKKRFADYTAASIGNYLTIILDGKVIESAVIQSEITGPAQISGSMTMAQATALAAQLVSGELPLMMTLVNVEQATPTTKLGPVSSIISGQRGRQDTRCRGR
jgi:preprotein translocase subunit SecD